MTNRDTLATWLDQIQEPFDSVLQHDPAVIFHTFEGATLGSIGAITAHAVFNVDGMVNGKLRKQPSVWESGEWAAKLGFDFASSWQSLNWARETRYEPAILREYAATVRASVAAYTAGADDAELSRQIQAGPNTMRVDDFLGSIVIWHALAHQGEISALLGLQGLQGSPY